MGGLPAQGLGERTGHAPCRGDRPPTLVLPHKGGGDRSRCVPFGARSKQRNTKTGASGKYENLPATVSNRQKRRLRCEKERRAVERMVEEKLNAGTFSLGKILTSPLALPLAGGRFGVGLFACPEGATTYQPRATPWVRSESRMKLEPCNGGTIEAMFRPFRARAFWYTSPYPGR